MAHHNLDLLTKLPQRTSLIEGNGIGSNTPCSCCNHHLSPRFALVFGEWLWLSASRLWQACNAFQACLEQSHAKSKSLKSLDINSTAPRHRSSVQACMPELLKRCTLGAPTMAWTHRITGIDSIKLIHFIIYRLNPTHRQLQLCHQQLGFG